MGKEAKWSAEQHSLTRSIGTYHSESFALRHGERDILYDLDSVERDREALYRENGGVLHGGD
jgi:hypothetical protein